MKQLVTLAALAGLLFAVPLQAAEQNHEALIAQCEQDAKAKNAQDFDAHVNACLDEKLEYEKEG